MSPPQRRLHRVDEMTEGKAESFLISLEVARKGLNGLSITRSRTLKHAHQSWWLPAAHAPNFSRPGRARQGAILSAL